MECHNGFSNCSIVVTIVLIFTIDHHSICRDLLVVVGCEALIHPAQTFSRFRLVYHNCIRVLRKKHRLLVSRFANVPQVLPTNCRSCDFTTAFVARKSNSPQNKTPWIYPIVGNLSFKTSMMWGVAVGCQAGFIPREVADGWLMASWPMETCSWLMRSVISIQEGRLYKKQWWNGKVFKKILTEIVYPKRIKWMSFSDPGSTLQKLS